MDNATPQAPVAKQVPSNRTHHGDTVADPYAWLADRDDPDTTAYLTAENSYTEARTAHLADLRQRIFTEIKSRTQETDLSVPYRKGDWWYYTRTQEGKQYAIRCRRKASPGETEPPPTEPPATESAAVAGEEVLLDENVVAGESEFFALGAFDVSPDGRLLAYSTDYEGNERYTMRVKDLGTGETLADEIPNTFYGTAWSLDGSVLYYLTVDETWRPDKVWRHRVGTPASEDVVAFTEADERFWVSVGRTRSERYIAIELSSKVTSEAWVVDAADPAGEPRVVRPREQGVEYEIEHHGEHFLVLHNDSRFGGGVNFTLSTAPVTAPQEWTPLIAHRDDTRLLSADAFAGHLVVHYRRNGLTGLRVLPVGADVTDLGEPRDIDFGEPVFSVAPHINAEFDTGWFRLRYASLVTPASVYDCEVATGELVLRKQEPVLGGYDPKRYTQHREWATAPDGTKVPISVVCRADIPRDGSAPCLLYGYGSYESSIDPWFSIPRLSLLDRGFVYALAHVRGGGELGRRWYDDGKMLHKKNTFTDFIACAERMVATGWTAPGRLLARGGSAGGLLMGAVANLAPEKFRGIMAEVPFVDALNTILDPSLPLTVTEWEEWGNPLDDPEVYAYMKSYSPYENISAQRYPAILAVAGLNDTRVLYHEPAKWVAKLRELSPETDVLLKTDMGAGHGGPSGRYNAWREEAFFAAWLIDQASAPHEPLS